MNIELYLKLFTRLYEVISDFSKFNLDGKNATNFALIKGAIQSGKSAIIHALLLLFTMVYEHNVIVLLRSFTEDYEQMSKGFQLFLEKYQDHVFEQGHTATRKYIPKIYYTGNVHRKKNGELQQHDNLCTDLALQKTVIFTIANHQHLKNLNECMDIAGTGPTTLIVDEVDQLLYTSGDVLSIQLENLLGKVSNVFGISATLYEPFHNSLFNFTSHHVLLPPENYKGVLDINFNFIEKLDPKRKKKYPKNILKWDKSLSTYLKDHKYDTPFGSHPCITLIKTERLKKLQQELQYQIANHKNYSQDYTVLTYNGESTTLYSSMLCRKHIVFASGKKSKQDGNHHVFSKTSIQDVLQYLKENGGAQIFPRILIIAHGLVGRGINIVSADYQWHLTQMFYRPSRNATITIMLQSLRLCGIYNDNIPLTCYIEKTVYENIYRGFKLQEDIFSRLEQNGETLREQISEEKFLRDKIPRKKMSKSNDFCGTITTVAEEDTGMSLEEFNQHLNLQDAKESYDHIVINKKLIAKWVDLTDNLLGKMLRFLYDSEMGVSLEDFKTGVDYRKSDESWMSNVANGAPGGKYSKMLKYPRIWYKQAGSNLFILDTNIRKIMDEF